MTALMHEPPRMNMNRDLHTELTFVTPDIAKEWLSANQQNRKLKKKVAERIADDIKNGRWLITHQGIAFDVNGMLRDGQHRLYAIVLANVGVWMNVTRNLDPKSLLAIDNIVIRSSADQMTIAGGLGQVSHGEVAVLRKMISGLGANAKKSVSAEMELMSEHREAISFAMKKLSSGVGSISPVRAVAARAFYSADLNRLERFCAVLREGMSQNEDESPIRLLWKDLVNNKRGGDGGEQQRSRYGKTERALFAYLHGETLGHLYASTKELFPLPGEFDEKPEEDESK